MADKPIEEQAPKKPDEGGKTTGTQSGPAVQTTNIELGNVDIIKIKLLAEIRDIMKEQLKCSMMILEEMRK